MQKHFQDKYLYHMPVTSLQADEYFFKCLCLCNFVLIEMTLCQKSQMV